MRRELSLSLSDSRWTRIGLDRWVSRRVFARGLWASCSRTRVPAGDLQERMNMLPEKTCVLIANNGLEECFLLSSYI